MQGYAGWYFIVDLHIVVVVDILVLSALVVPGPAG